ncbi:MAG: 30S ribosomal protein S18 [Alphaproteobacteria bacterium RIFCSPHIGHO2_12_FULL_45_9]|nr:MAG: 30S ribosomal protein S18 [Alphaproteobacteria bacterium RIFCSPHIGHO2_02_FULL_46_13]OFW93987.1 MAG: 30S ribosomal protein S18 [Alphaproteobacteria bacterium RIFCSPHIGHO2_12_FULL_45_9]
MARPERNSAERAERPEAAADGADAGAKKSFFKRRKSCPFSGKDAQAIDWKDVRTLGRYVSERGKMMPSRITSVCQKKQRELAQAIKRSRYMALMPYVRTEMENTRGPRPERSFDRPERSYSNDRSDRPSRDNAE